MAPRRLARAESAARTRERLLRAGSKVFLERGYHGASLESVAKEAGFTIGAVYSRFEGKADLFFEVLEVHNATVLADLARALESARTLADLNAVSPRWWTTRLRGGSRWSLLLVEFWVSAGRDPALRARFSEHHEQFLERVAGLIDEQVVRVTGRAGERTRDLARATSALGHGLALELLVSPHRVPDELIDWAFGFVQLTAGRPPAARKLKEG